MGVQKRVADIQKVHVVLFLPLSLPPRKQGGGGRWQLRVVPQRWVTVGNTVPQLRLLPPRGVLATCGCLPERDTEGVRARFRERFKE